MKNTLRYHSRLPWPCGHDRSLPAVTGRCCNGHHASSPTDPRCHENVPFSWLLPCFARQHGSQESNAPLALENQTQSDFSWILMSRRLSEGGSKVIFALRARPPCTKTAALFAGTEGVLVLIYAKMFNYWIIISRFCCLSTGKLRILLPIRDKKGRLREPALWRH